MHERLFLMRELLAENGSIYVHLDWHVGHYVKVMMDQADLFGYQNSLNEVTWAYRTGGTLGREPGFSKKHDVILLYSKSGRFCMIQVKMIEFASRRKSAEGKTQ